MPVLNIMFKLYPSTIQYLPGLECEEEEDMFDEENVNILEDTLHSVRTEHKHSLQVGNYRNLTNISVHFMSTDYPSSFELRQLKPHRHNSTFPPNPNY